MTGSESDPLREHRQPGGGPRLEPTDDIGDAREPELVSSRQNRTDSGTWTEPGIAPVARRSSPQRVSTRSAPSAIARSAASGGRRSIRRRASANRPSIVFRSLIVAPRGPVSRSPHNRDDVSRGPARGACQATASPRRGRPYSPRTPRLAPGPQLRTGRSALFGRWRTIEASRKIVAGIGGRQSI